MTTIRGYTHDPDSPVLRGEEEARATFRYQSVTLGQGGCPFCSMSVETETELEDLVATLLRDAIPANAQD